VTISEEYFRKMTYHFSKNLRKSYVADLQKTYKNLTTNLGKILRSFENRVPGPAGNMFVAAACRKNVLSIRTSCFQVAR